MDQDGTEQKEQQKKRGDSHRDEGINRGRLQQVRDLDKNEVNG